MEIITGVTCQEMSVIQHTVCSFIWTMQKLNKGHKTAFEQYLKFKAETLRSIFIMQLLTECQNDV